MNKKRRRCTRSKNFIREGKSLKTLGGRRVGCNKEEIKSSKSSCGGKRV